MGHLQERVTRRSTTGDSYTRKQINADNQARDPRGLTCRDCTDLPTSRLISQRHEALIFDRGLVPLADVTDLNDSCEHFKAIDAQADSAWQVGHRLFCQTAPVGSFGVQPRRTPLRQPKIVLSCFSDAPFSAARIVLPVRFYGETLFLAFASFQGLAHVA